MKYTPTEQEFHEEVLGINEVQMKKMLICSATSAIVLFTGFIGKYVYELCHPTPLTHEAFISRVNHSLEKEYLTDAEKRFYLSYIEEEEKHLRLTEDLALTKGDILVISKEYMQAITTYEPLIDSKKSTIQYPAKAAINGILLALQGSQIQEEKFLRKEVCKKYPYMFGGCDNILSK